MKNLLHVRDLDDLHLAADSLFSAEALLFGALQIVVSKHPGIAAGADFIGYVHGLSLLGEATIAIALLVRLLKDADAVSSNPCAKHHDDLQNDIDHVSHSR
jgi:hypothetical protein